MTTSPKRFYIHVQDEAQDTEVVYPILAKSLDEAAEHAEKHFELQGWIVNRIRPHYEVR
ncbi:MAG: host cell RNA polymerase inhibitor [Cetobacterium sp.]|uniref:host cell RNA polymerase inhibitor n=1 Tax=Cetobacterium sp. TaxID=2071632 RepID=UPI003EE5D473